MKYIINLWKQHRSLCYLLCVFIIVHTWLWFNYYTSSAGIIKRPSFSSGWFLFSYLIYTIVYIDLFAIAYSHGKKIFLFLVSWFIFSLTLTIPFSLAKVDLDVKFILLLKSNYQWEYISNYIGWIIFSFAIMIPCWILVLKFLSHNYKYGLKISRAYKICIISIFIFLSFWNVSLHGSIDTEAQQKLYYDNELLRATRVMIALTVRDFDVFNYKELDGEFQLNTQSPVQSIYAFLDTLEYEFLSIHGNSGVPYNTSLKKLIDEKKIIDMGVFYTCGSHTTASTPNMMSMNNCRIGPNFSSEPIMHLFKRIEVSNHFIGLDNLSQYFAAVFMQDAPIDNRTYLTVGQTAKSLSIAAQNIQKYPRTKNSFTMIYYDAVHPGITCDFLVEGGFNRSICNDNHKFSQDTYQYGMNKAIEIIEKDIVSFINILEKDPKPVFLVLTADHGLSPNFLHGDMADSDVSVANIQEATQRHSNLLIYGNKSYREKFSSKWKNLIYNQKYQGFLNHDILVPTIIDGLDIKWSLASEKIVSQSLFSPHLIPALTTEVKMNPYLIK